jgi:UDP-N-acetylglucosamine 2-epimerase (non-hydrolysing)
LKLLFSFGTRPEAIKMASVVLECRNRNLEHVVCVTAQHREMLDQVLEWFDIVPDYDLDLMEKGQNLNKLTAKIYSSIDPILQNENPDIVLVQGDTTTALTSAMAAFHRNIPVGHIEAGLRTYDFSAPFPEEMNRQIISKIARYHFTPTDHASKNLISESVSIDKILKTGNTVVDALYWSNQKIFNGFENDFIQKWSDKLVTLKPWILVTAHRRENFGAGLKNLSDAILELAQEYNCNIIWPVHPNPNVTLGIGEELKNLSRIHLIDPIDYPSMVWLMQQVDVIISDSGGIQEEAPTFDVPVLVTRESTERPEGIEAGTSTLVGMNQDKIVQNVLFKLKNSKNDVVKTHLAMG